MLTAGRGLSAMCVPERETEAYCHNEHWPEFPNLCPTPCMGYVEKPGKPLPFFSTFPRPILCLPPPGSPWDCPGPLRPHSSLPAARIVSSASSCPWFLGCPV